MSTTNDELIYGTVRGLVEAGNYKYEYEQPWGATMAEVAAIDLGDKAALLEILDSKEAVKYKADADGNKQIVREFENGDLRYAIEFLYSDGHLTVRMTGQAAPV